jgi:hypothetical protein
MISIVQKHPTPNYELWLNIQMKEIAISNIDQYVMISYSKFPSVGAILFSHSEIYLSKITSIICEKYLPLPYDPKKQINNVQCALCLPSWRVWSDAYKNSFTDQLVSPTSRFDVNCDGLIVTTMKRPFYNCRHAKSNCQIAPLGRMR